MAKEHGMMEHKGKTIPKEVKSLADRIRKEQPDKDDEYAYRTAWDIFRSYTSEGKSYPHKSTESGLAREGGGTGSIKHAFWSGFQKKASWGKAIGTLTGYSDFRRGSDIIGKAVKSGKMTPAGAVVGNFAKRKAVAGSAMAGGLGRMGLTAGATYYGVKQMRGPNGSQESSI